MCNAQPIPLREASSGPVILDGDFSPTPGRNGGGVRARLQSSPAAEDAEKRTWQSFVKVEQSEWSFGLK